MTTPYAMYATSSEVAEFLENLRQEHFSDALMHPERYKKVLKGLTAAKLRNRWYSKGFIKKLSAEFEIPEWDVTPLIEDAIRSYIELESRMANRSVCPAADFISRYKILDGFSPEDRKEFGSYCKKIYLDYLEKTAGEKGKK
jgi:hypothetical protein